MIGSLDGPQLALNSTDLLRVGNNSFTVRLPRSSGVVAFGTVSINLLADALPTVTKVPSGEVSVLASSAVIVKAKIRTASCITRSASTTAYWAQILTDSRYSSTSIKYVTKGPKLKIRPGTLRVGAGYLFNLTAVTTDAQGQVIGQVRKQLALRVREEDVAARLGGGPVRNATVGVRNYMIQWSAAGSYDPANESRALDYRWSVASQTGNVPIPFSLVDADPSRIQVNSSRLQGGAVYNVTLAVEGSRSVLGGRRIATRQQTLYAFAASRPSLIVDLADPRLNSSKLDPARRVRMLAVLDSAYTEGDVGLSWSCAQLALGPSNLHTDTNTLELVLSQGALVAGQTYTFVVTATGNLNRLTGSAAVTIRTNEPPRGGACSVSPMSGTALVTYFAFECSNWTDADKPLQYRFQIARGAILCSGFSEADECETILPRPREESASHNVTVEVRDFLGATTSALPVTVNISAPGTELNVSGTVATAQESLDRGDLDAFAVYIDEATELLATDRAPNATAAAGQVSDQESLIESIENLQQRDLAVTADEDVTLPIALVRRVAQASIRNQVPLSTENQARAMRVIRRSLESQFAAYRTADVSGYVEALGGVVHSTFDTAPSGNDAVEQANTSSSVVSTLLSVGSSWANDMLSGETVQSMTSDDGNVELAVGINRKSAIGATNVSLQSGASVRVPHNLSISGSAQVKLLVASMESNTYPTSSDSSGLVVVELEQNGQTLNISNATQPFRLRMPPGDASSGSVGSRLVCRYWDPVVGNWSTKGLVAAENATTDQPVCLSSHLSAFNVQFKVEINTIDADDVTWDAFSHKNAMMLMTSTLIVALAVALLVSVRYDQKLAVKGGHWASEKFWRDFNLVRQMRVESRGRSIGTWRKVSWWSLRRRHPWLSLFLRHEGDFLNTTKRIGILGVLIFNTMAVCALMIGREQQILFLSPVISAALVGMVISFPIPFVLGVVYRRQVPGYLAIPLRRKKNEMGFSATWCCFLTVGLLFGELMIEDLSAEGDVEDEGVQDSDSEMGGEDDDGGDSESEDDDDAKMAGGALGAAAGGAAGVGTGAFLANLRAERKRRLAEQGYRYESEESEEDKDFTVELPDDHPFNLIDPDTPRSEVARADASYEEHLRQAETTLRAEVLGLEHPSVMSSDTENEDEEPGFNDRTWKFTDGKWVPRTVSKFWSKSKRRLDEDGKASSKLKRMGTTSNFVVAPTQNKASRNARENDISTHVWTKHDIIGMAVCMISILGGWFVTVVLSWKLVGEDSSGWVSATFYAFLQDIGFRVLQIFIIEALFFLPCCCCCALAQAFNNRPRDDEIDVEFRPGFVGFWFEETRVVDVDSHSPAHDKGVRIGMTVVSVADVKVDNEDDLRYEMYAAHRTLNKFTIRFKKFQHDAIRTTGGIDAKFIGADANVESTSESNNNSETARNFGTLEDVHDE